MSNITDLPVPADIRKEAEAWIIRLDGNDNPSTSDKAQLTAWLARSPLHRQELDAANQFWGNNILTTLEVPSANEQHHQAQSSANSKATIKPNQQPHQQPHQQPNQQPNQQSRPKSNIKRGLAIAAVLLLAVILLPLFNAFSPNSNGLYVTAVGQRNTIHLSDGSTVELNTNSQIDVKFSDKFRNIRLLQGEAHFNVAHNPNKPFRVYAAGNRVQAVGTAFSLHIIDQSLQVLVTEGRVGLAALSHRLTDKAPIKLDSFTHNPETELGILEVKESILLAEPSQTPPQSAEALQKELQQAITTISDEELYRRVSWRDGLLVFQGETLEEAVKEISRYTTIAIEIPETSVKNLQVGGRFHVSDISALLSALETNFNLKADYTGYNHVRLLSNQQL